MGVGEGGGTNEMPQIGARGFRVSNSRINLPLSIFIYICSLTSFLLSVLSLLPLLVLSLLFFLFFFFSFLYNWRFHSGIPRKQEDRANSPERVHHSSEFLFFTSTTFFSYFFCGFFVDRWYSWPCHEYQRASGESLSTPRSFYD